MIDKRDPEAIYKAMKSVQGELGCSILEAADRVLSSVPVCSLPTNGAAPASGSPSPQAPFSRPRPFG